MPEPEEPGFCGFFRLNFQAKTEGQKRPREQFKSFFKSTTTEGYCRREAF